jgi:hypothetical protein
MDLLTVHLNLFYLLNRYLIGLAIYLIGKIGRNCKIKL